MTWSIVLIAPSDTMVERLLPLSTRFSSALHACSATVLSCMCCFMAPSTASIPPKDTTFALVSLFAARFLSAPHVWYATPLSYTCCFMASSTASMPPSSASRLQAPSHSQARCAMAMAPCMATALEFGNCLMSCTAMSGLTRSPPRARSLAALIALIALGIACGVSVLDVCVVGCVCVMCVLLCCVL